LARVIAMPACCIKAVGVSSPDELRTMPMLAAV
jgi:hypothetical protein